MYLTHAHPISPLETKHCKPVFSILWPKLLKPKFFWQINRVKSRSPPIASHIEFTNCGHIIPTKTFFSIVEHRKIPHWWMSKRCNHNHNNFQFCNHLKRADLILHQPSYPKKRLSPTLPWTHSLPTVASIYFYSAIIPKPQLLSLVPMLCKRCSSLNPINAYFRYEYRVSAPRPSRQLHLAYFLHGPRCSVHTHLQSKHYTYINLT